jgi:hypothetical protein
MNRYTTKYVARSYHISYSYYGITYTKGYVAVEQEEVQAVDTSHGLFVQKL